MTLLDWLIVVAAFTAEQLVDVPADASVGWAVLGGGAWAVFGFALQQAWRRWPAAESSRSAMRRRLAAAGIVGVAAIVPPAVAGVVAWQAVPTACGGEGASPEALMLAVIRGLVCARLAVGTSTSEIRFSLAMTLFLVVLAAIVNDHPATPVVHAAYAALAAAGLAAEATRRSGGSCLPGPVGLGACLAVAMTVAALGGSREACGRALAGWLPLSGGDSFAFPWARDGVGDGEHLVAADKHPQGTGPVNSGLFVTSHKPSLYDLFSDLYGEPERPKLQQRRRAFGLSPEDFQQTDRHLADSEHAGREFSTVRKPRPRSRPPAADLAARSLVTLTGPAPAHLRLAVYDRFDGRTWRDQPPPAATAGGCRLEHAGGDWMRWHGVSRPPATDHHAITIGSVETSVLPLPARADALRIDKIDRADFFRTPADDVVTLDGIPATAGTTVHARSLPGGVDAAGAVAVAVPPALDATAAAAAPAWAGHVLDAWDLERPAAGTWPHVARVVAEVGRRLARDDEAGPPADCPDTLRHALTVSHRGRPYDFAGATAVLLRACGYATRVVGGLYVSGERRDPRSRRLVATAADAHVWAEIRDAAGRWIPLEPTPGYRVRPPAVTWAQRVLAGLGSAAAWAAARAAVIAAAIAGLALVAAAALGGWRWGVDLLVTARWRRQVRRGAGCPLHATWRLLAWRAWLAGCGKRPHETLRDWHRRAVEPARLGRQTLPFLSGFERAVYGPAAVPADQPRRRRIAVATERIVTVARLRGVEAHPRPRLVRPALITGVLRWQRP